MKKRPHPIRKKWGQNFLNDINLLNKIVEVVKPQAEDYFLEIGPGDGALTEKILPNVHSMTSVEIDPLLVKSLSNNSQLKELSIIQDDILNIDIEDLSMRKPVRILGNIPYNITSSIIFWLIEQLDFWSDAYIMMQREVAERLIADVGTKQYGRISVVTSVYLKKTICLNIPPEVFYPKPKVRSSLIKFTKRTKSLVRDDEFVKFNNLVRTAFSMRRKMIKNTLAGYDFSSEVKNSIDFTRRPETISPEEFALLTKSIL